MLGIDSFNFLIADMSWDLKKIIEKLKKMTSESKTRNGSSQKRENPAFTIQCQQLLAPYEARITLKQVMTERESLHLTDAFKPINQI